MSADYKAKLTATLVALGKIDALIDSATKAARDAGLTDICNLLEYYSDESNEKMDQVRDMIAAAGKRRTR